MCAKWRHLAPFGAMKFAKWRHVANKWRQNMANAHYRQMSPFSSPNGAKSGAIWRHLAIANPRHSPNLGDTWRHRHVAMPHSLKKTMRKIFIAKRRRSAPFGDKCSSSQMAPFGAISRQITPNFAIWGFITISRQMALNVAKFRHMAPFGGIWRILSMN